MNKFLKLSALLLITAFPAFTQGETSENDLFNNEPYWRQALGGAVLSVPHIQAQSAVIAVDGGNIRAFSASGAPMWYFSAGGRISPYITRSREGTSYLSRTNGTLIAVNRSGRELWRRNTGSPLIAKAITGWDGRLFAPTEKKISCYTASGNLLWTRTFESSFYLAPKLDRGGGLIFVLENNQCCRLDPFGNVETYYLSALPAVILSIDQKQILVLYKDRKMEIIGISEDWFFSAQSEVNSDIVTLPNLPAAPVAAVIRTDNVAAVLEDGRIALVSLNEGKILWDGKTHISGRAEKDVEMLFDERGIYILSKDGASGFSIDGRRLWYTNLQNAAAIPAFGEDGVLYSGGNDWILYAYKIEDRFLPYRGSIYGPAPEGSYRLDRPQVFYIPDYTLDENEIKTKLEQIEAAVKSGRVEQNEPAWITFLLIVSAGRNNIQNRIKALNLLGQIGSRETIPWLTDIFRKEKEPLIRAAAASAVGAIGVDPEGIAIQTFLYMVIQAGIQDEQILIAIISATGALCRFSGPPLSETGIRILNLIIDGSSPAIVRQHANKELASLW